MLQHMSNLIVILFNFMYPVLYVGFLCIGCVCERVKTQDKLKIKGDFMSSSREDFLRSEAMCSAHDWNAKSHDRWWQLVFASISRVRPSHKNTRKTFCFAILSYLIHQVSIHTIYTHITHILRGVFFKEKTLAITLESERLLYPQSSTQSIVIFLNLYLSISKSLRGW